MSRPSGYYLLFAHEKHEIRRMASGYALAGLRNINDYLSTDFTETKFAGAGKSNLNR